jgi:hypothetical protein
VAPPGGTLFIAKRPAVSNQLIMASFGFGRGEGVTPNARPGGMRVRRTALGGRWAGGWAQSSVFIFTLRNKGSARTRVLSGFDGWPLSNTFAAFFFFTLFGFFHGE